ncbi:hypothetical protein NIES267_43810 [Calothrix parasitica NIES-267]|uniref:Uncharacterized protein n=1 Tax=Calothrix parasitica NIES-267 TaxID=1973488 RepID=A0A1Z4LUJ5_9CYAN|nr:hypothetical protein NIES267_43810 [Calothrix parasitica NIES-267]
MNDFIQKIKLFYSQNYKEVYNEGELIDAKSLYPSQSWDFEVSGLENYSEEEAYLEECGYSLKTQFNLEDVPKLVNELLLKTKPRYPENFVKSYRFYQQVFKKTDSGSVCTFVVTINRLRIFTSYAISDGGDGWLEIFDIGGNNLGAARTNGTRIAWHSLDFIRDNFQRRYQE